MSHGLPYSLPWGHGSIGFFADGPADRLIIFVHGFGGKAMKTWTGMHDLLEEPGAAAADLVFYGYGSLAAPAQNSASLFRQFLCAAANQERNWRFNTERAGADPTIRDYQDILIVAHSLGAAVVRRALLDAIGLKESWVERCRLVLFGPAHKGTRLVELQKQLRSRIGGILSDLFTFGRVKVPVLDDLAEGSPFLAKLLSDSEAAIAGGWAAPLTAKSVIFGERDYVVLTEPFANDPYSTVWADEDHTSVCRVPQTPSEVARHL